MRPFTLSIDIDRPVEEVFAYVTDTARLHEWQAGVVEVRRDGPLQAGSRLIEVRQGPGGRRVEQIVEVAAYDPPHVFDLRIVDGPVEVHGDHRFESRDGGTRVEVTAHGRLPGAKRLLRPLLPRVLARHYRRLKQNLEAGA